MMSGGRGTPQLNTDLALSTSVPGDTCHAPHVSRRAHPWPGRGHVSSRTKLVTFVFVTRGTTQTGSCCTHIQGICGPDWDKIFWIDGNECVTMFYKSQPGE